MQQRIENLISSVGSMDLDVQERVARELAEIGQPAIDPLYNVLQDGNKDFFMRQGCAYALVKIGKPTVDRFIAGLKDEDAVIRHLSAWALGKLKEPRAVEPLIAVIEDTTPRNTTFALILGKKEPIDNSIPRSHAVSSLGELKDSRAIKSLIVALTDQDIAGGALLALQDITGEDFGEDPAKWDEWYQNKRK